MMQLMPSISLALAPLAPKSDRTSGETAGGRRYVAGHNCLSGASVAVGRPAESALIPKGQRLNAPQYQTINR
jgi:hypothetical protein